MIYLKAYLKDLVMMLSCLGILCLFVNIAENPHSILTYVVYVMVLTAVAGPIHLWIKNRYDIKKP